MTMQQTDHGRQHTTPGRPKVKKAPQPKKCLLAIGYPAEEPLTYRYETIGYFPTKTAAKKAVKERQAQNPDLLFLILETNADPRAAVYQKFADALER